MSRNESISVTVKLPDGTRVSTPSVWNISLGGVFVEMPDPLGFGTEVGVDFAIEQPARRIQCDGFVVWTTREAPEKAEGLSGVGLRLVNIGIAEMRLVAEQVGKRLQQGGKR